MLFRSVFIAARGLSLVAVKGGYSSLRCLPLIAVASPVVGSRCTGFSSCGPQAPEHRLSSCGARAWLLHGMWDLPRPGLEPVSPVLAGRFSTTAPPGKPYQVLLVCKSENHLLENTQNIKTWNILLVTIVLLLSYD